jgi:protein-L-isoaspartate(D-aspartate) O-methyltransferase
LKGMGLPGLSFLLGALLAVSCGDQKPAASGVTPTTRGNEAERRARMVETQIVARGVRDARVLAVMREVPRHLFVPESEAAHAYEDHPLPIGWNQTISQPYIVALMTELAEISPEEKVLEIGTGSGYQSAVLARLAREVYSIEIVPGLARESAERLKKLGYANATVREGDGYRGWGEHAPFDAIIVTAAPDRIPQPLLDQLAPGGRMVIPVGKFFQELKVLSKDKNGKISEKDILPVRFVPMTGEIEKTPSKPE